MLTDTDKTYQGLIAGCFDMPERCPLIKHGATPAEVSEKLDRVFDDIKLNPIPIKNGLVTYTSLRNYIMGNLYWAVRYPNVAIVLDAVLSRNTTTLAAYVPSASEAPDTGSTEAIIGIRCSDKFLRTDDVNDVLPEYNRTYANSALFGDATTSTIKYCSRWGFKAKERYSGDFQVKPAFPPLLVNNRHDPITPLRSAHNVSAGFEGSVVLESTGFGVSSLSLAKRMHMLTNAKACVLSTPV
jgi:hypothetical protein